MGELHQHAEYRIKGKPLEMQIQGSLSENVIGLTYLREQVEFIGTYDCTEDLPEDELSDGAGAT